MDDTLTYLRPGVPGFLTIVRALARLDAEVLCMAPGLAPDAARQLVTRRLRIALGPVDLPPLLQQADLAIGYGNAGFSTQALLAGVPLLMRPRHVEQALFAQRVEALGAGRLLAGRLDTQGVVAAVQALLDEPACRQAARAFAQRHRDFTPQAAIDKTLAAIEQRFLAALGRCAASAGRRCTGAPQGMPSLTSFASHTHTDPQAFHPPLIRLQHSAPNPQGRRLLWALLALLAFLIVWALVGRLDIVAVADGKLVPASYLKIVQPSEAGIVKEILVREGETVRAGQVLMRMDALMTEADDLSAIATEHARRRLQLIRIDAELSGRPLPAPADAPATLAQEAAAQYRANREALAAALAEERSSLVKAQQELAAARQQKERLEAVLPHYREQDKAYEKMVKEGFAGGLMGSDKRRERIEKEQELATKRTSSPPPSPPSTSRSKNSGRSRRTTSAVCTPSAWRRRASSTA